MPQLRGNEPILGLNIGLTCKLFLQPFRGFLTINSRLQLQNLITPQPCGTMWRTTYCWKHNDEENPSMRVLFVLVMFFKIFFLIQIWAS
jgi:hypothetical protein